MRQYVSYIDDLWSHPGSADLLDVDVCTNEGVVQQENFALLGLKDLSFLPIHCLNQYLTQYQLPLV